MFSRKLGQLPQEAWRVFPIGPITNARKGAEGKKWVLEKRGVKQKLEKDP